MSLSWLNRWMKKPSQVSRKRPAVRLELECLEDRCLLSTYQLPVYHAPVYHAPVYQAPVYQAPVYQAPIHQAPPTPTFSVLPAPPAPTYTPHVVATPAATTTPALSVSIISTTPHPIVTTPTVSYDITEASARAPVSTSAPPAAATAATPPSALSVSLISARPHPIVTTPNVSYNVSPALNANPTLSAGPNANNTAKTLNNQTAPATPGNPLAGEVRFNTVPTGSVTLANGTVVSNLGQLLTPNDQARAPSREEMEQIGILLRTAELNQIINLPNTGPGYNDPTQTSTVNEKLAAQAQLNMLSATAAAFNPYQGISQEMIRLGVDKQVDPKVFNWILLNEYSFPAPSVLPSLTPSSNLFHPATPVQAMTPQQSLENYLNYVKPTFNTDAAQTTATPLDQATIDHLSHLIEQAFTQQAFQAFQDGTGSALDAALRQANPWAVGYAFNTHGSVYAGMANDAISTGAIAQLTPGQWESLLADNGIPVWGNGLQNIGSGDDSVQNIPFVGGTNDNSGQPGQGTVHFRLQPGERWVPGTNGYYVRNGFIYDSNNHAVGIWKGTQAIYMPGVVPTPTATDHAPSAPSLRVRTYNLDQPAPANTHYGTDPGASGSKQISPWADENNWLNSPSMFLHLAPRNVDNARHAPMAPQDYFHSSQVGSNPNYQPTSNVDSSNIGQGTGTRFNQNAGGQANWQGGGTINRSQARNFHSNLH